MLRKILMLVTIVVLTASAGWSGGAVYTYCEGECEPTGQTAFYTCGYNVSAFQCCSRARANACPGGGFFTGTCTETYGTIWC